MGGSCLAQVYGQVNEAVLLYGSFHVVGMFEPEAASFITSELPRALEEIPCVKLEKLVFSIAP